MHSTCNSCWSSAKELRAYLLYSVGQTGGHFGAGLGVIELAVALHHVYNTPHDRIVWDVGHQTYPHKILTGRRDQMHSMRQADGLAGFPKRSESEYDTFGVGTLLHQYLRGHGYGASGQTAGY